MEISSRAIAAIDRKIEKSNEAAEKARQRARELTAEADQLNATAESIIIEDENAAEKKYQRADLLRRKAQALNRRAGQVDSETRDLRVQRLVAEADALEEEGAKLAKQGAEKEADILKLKRQLEELDGNSWARVEPRPGEGEFTIVPTGADEDLLFRAQHVMRQAAAIRFWQANGRLPTHTGEIRSDAVQNLHVEHPFMLNVHSRNSVMDYFTDSLMALAEPDDDYLRKQGMIPSM
ncbi:hypothetical protein [Zhihengliuella halotolerans]|uniref:hypothetical protein n=1 Tax=Zhihengliuella halotolerans TaxID=370736 RepID=UPI000C7FCDA8|nr:hypothetical protein [Zhihengliuella halotolerans]